MTTTKALNDKRAILDSKSAESAGKLDQDSEQQISAFNLQLTETLKRDYTDGRKYKKIEVVVSNCVPEKSICPICGEQCRGGTYKEHALKVKPYRHFIDNQPSEYFRLKCKDCNMYFINEDHLKMHQQVAATYKVQSSSSSSMTRVNDDTEILDMNDAAPTLPASRDSSDMLQKLQSKAAATIVTTDEEVPWTSMTAANIPRVTTKTPSGDLKPVPIAVKSHNLEYLYLAVFFKSHNVWMDIDDYWKELYFGIEQVHKCLKMLCETNTPSFSTSKGGGREGLLWREMTEEFYFKKGLDLSLAVNHDQKVKVNGRSVGLSVAATTAVGLGHILQNKFAAVCDVPNTNITVLLCNTHSMLHYILIHDCGINLDMISSTDFLLIILYEGIASIVERNSNNNDTSSSYKRTINPRSCLKSSHAESIRKTSSNNDLSNVSDIDGMDHKGNGLNKDNGDDDDDDDDNDNIKIAKANALVNQNVLRGVNYHPGLIPISDEVMSSYEMDALMKKVLIDFKFCCQSYIVGQKVMHGEVKIIDKHHTKFIPTSFSDEYFKISDDHNYMIRVSMIYPDKTNILKPVLSFPCWLTSSCCKRIHSLALEVDCVSDTLSHSKNTTQGLENDGEDRYIVVSPVDSIVAIFRNKVEDIYVKDGCLGRSTNKEMPSFPQANMSAGYQHNQEKGNNCQQLQQRRSSTHLTSKPLSLANITEIHRSYYDAYVRNYPGSKVRIMSNGVDFQVVNPDESIFFDTMEIKEEGLCRLPIGYDDNFDIDIIGNHSVSVPNIDLVTFELAEKGTQWQLKFPDGDTFNPERLDALLEGRLEDNHAEIDIFNKSDNEQDRRDNRPHNVGNVAISLSSAATGSNRGYCQRSDATFLPQDDEDDEADVDIF